MLREKLQEPFFFIELTVTGIIYLDILREWLMPQLQEEIPHLPHSTFIMKRGLT
jgi:hypothetical protein